MASAVLLQHPDTELTLQPARIKAVTISALPLVHATFDANMNYRRGTDVLKILLKIDRLNRDFGCF